MESGYDMDQGKLFEGFVSIHKRMITSENNDDDDVWTSFFSNLDDAIITNRPRMG
jgi:phage-related protein